MAWKGNGKGSGSHDTELTSTSAGLINRLHEYLVELGVRAERKGDLQAALDLYQEAVRTQPDSAAAWYNYGDVLLALKRYKESIVALRKAIALSPQSLLFHYDMGLALLALGQHQDACREFAPIVACDPKLKRASSNLVLSSLTNLALGQELSGQAGQAATTLAPARKVAADILYNLGRLTFLAGRPADALPNAQAAALLEPESEEVVHLVGRILMDLKRGPEALGQLRRATTLNRHCAAAWYDLGVTLARLRKRSEARSCFERVLDLDPTYAWSYYDLACLDALGGKRDAAFDKLQLAVTHGFKDIGHLRSDSDLRGMRRDARWKALEEKIRSKQRLGTEPERDDS